MNLSYLRKRTQVPLFMALLGLLTVYMAWEVLKVQIQALSGAPGIG